MDASPLIVLVAAGVAALAACTGARRARGSTAVPAAWWAAAACLALGADAAARCAGVAADPLVAARFRLLVAALAVCPTMSLLGAKRPQHGVWQVIVAALAVVVAMPAVSAWLVRPGSLPDVHPLGRGFLAVLLVAGWLNFVGTGRAVAATCIVAGQFALLRPFLPGVATDAALPQPALDATGALLVAAGALAAALRRPQPAERSAGSTATGGVTPAAAIDPPFLALRETLGAAWTLRIMERFDMVADERGWPCRLRFGGLETGGDPTDVAWHRDALRAFRALVRRFVDERWLARHGWPESA